MNRYDIVEKVTPLFIKHGFYSLKVDDIDKELTISKKSLYQVFRSKKLLIEDSIPHGNYSCNYL